MNTGVEILDQLSVLADATRVRLLVVLERQELTVSELCEVMQLPQSTVSRHLKTLAQGEWISSRPEGTSRLYAMVRDQLDRAQRRLWLLVREQVAASAASAQDELRLAEVVARRRSRSEEFFSTSAGQWDRMREELFGRSSHLRPLLLWLDPGWTVADLGCGTGQVTAAIAPSVARVVAIDDSVEMLDAARERLGKIDNVELVRSPLEGLPLDDQSFDAACIMLVLHHVPDPLPVLAEAARVMRAGAQLLIVDMLPHDHEEYRHTMGHVWLGFSEHQLARWLADAGFERLRWHVLPPEPASKGPTLFAAAAQRRHTAADESIDE
jgi:ArsR family transcriptional regulator